MPPPTSSNTLWDNKGPSPRSQSSSLIRHLWWPQESTRNQDGAWNCLGGIHQRYQRLLSGGNRQVLLAGILGTTARQGGAVPTAQLIVACMRILFFLFFV